MSNKLFILLIILKEELVISSERGNNSLELSRTREYYRVLLLQIYYTFVQAIPLLILIGVGAGIAVSFQAKAGLAIAGDHSHFGKILVVILFREVCPLFASLLLITRSATAVSSELATMKVGLEIEALNVMGIPISEYILKPRIWAGTVSIFCMAFCLFLSSLFGAWLGSNITGYFPVEYLASSLTSSFFPEDIFFFFFKTTIIGALVMKIACNRGLSLNKASFEVPIVTNMAVVDCLFAALLAQGCISALLYLIHGVGI